MSDPRNETSEPSVRTPSAGVEATPKEREAPPRNVSKDDVPDWCG